MSAFTKYDEVLSSILANEKSILGFLSAIFNFLARRTDFYHVPEGPYENIGFPPGVAEELVIKVLRTCDPKLLKAPNWAQTSIDLKNEMMRSTVAQVEVKIEANPDSDEEASQTMSKMDHSAEILKFEADPDSNEEASQTMFNIDHTAEILKFEADPDSDEEASQTMFNTDHTQELLKIKRDPDSDEEASQTMSNIDHTAVILKTSQQHQNSVSNMKSVTTKPPDIAIPSWSAVTKYRGGEGVNVKSASFVDDSSSDEEFLLKPAELIETVHDYELNFLPDQSREKYIKAYKLFTEWRRSKGFKTISDTIMLSYFTELSKKRKPNTLCSIYSMLKAVIKERNNIHIEKYSKLLAFLKKGLRGYKPKKSRAFTAAEILKFLNEAPDSKFLDTKVVLIIGVSGACKRHELAYLTTKNIEKHSENLMVVKLPDLKRKTERNFAIRDEYVKIVEKYQALRPVNTTINRLFLRYCNGKCMNQPMGHHKIGGMPQEIATFLNLDKPAEYTGFCFRRTAAALFSNSGDDLTTLRPATSKCNTAPEEKVQERWWDRITIETLMKSEEPIDLDKINYSRPLDELPEDHVAKVREQQWNQERKMMVLPTSDDIRNTDVLKKACNAPGSSIKREFDPSFLGSNSQIWTPEKHGDEDTNVEPAAFIDDSSSDEELNLKPAGLIETVHNDELSSLPNKSRESGGEDMNVKPAAFVDDSSSDEEFLLKPAELIETVHDYELNFLPDQTRQKYIKTYKLFTEWRRSKGFKTLSDTIMLSYFTELCKTRKPNTLWCIYSMLKTVIQERNNVQIEKYPKLLTFLKKGLRGYKPKKSRTFTAAEILQFLNEAPDSKFLDTKVVLIIGVSGACKRHELTYLTTKNIEKHSDKLLIVKLSDARRNMERNFAIRDEYVKIVEKYQALRPANTTINRFFLRYSNGKCTKQPIGNHKIGGMPQKIATFLNLVKPAEYTGYCFKRTAAVLFSNSGDDLTTLRPADGKCNTAPEEKIQERWWNRIAIETLMKSEEPIDHDKIDCSRPLDELPEDHVTKVREQQGNKERKVTGLPTSDEIRNMDVLKKACNAPGSPFKREDLNILGSNSQISIPGKHGGEDTNVEPAAFVDDSSSDEEFLLKPAELIETVYNDELISLPDKSRERYIKTYKLFTEWRRSKGSKTLSDTIMLSYFTELSKTRKSSTLWGIYSMLKAVIKERNNIQIEKYPKLLAFLKKKKMSRDKTQFSRTYTAAQILQFLNEAPDSEFLDTKVVLIIGVSGACKRNELTYLTTKNIEKHSEKLLVVKLPDPKTNMERNFAIRDEYVKIVEKYQALRPANTTINRFFLQYRDEKCTKKPMGTHKIGGIPQKIATFLNLDKPAEYTWQCFRKTAAVLFPDSGADLTTLRSAGGKCNTASERRK